ncbi:unnamed protein product [Clonostachys byssicola]|uniref:alcohol O-acetyltransferase n=1 Tax=Clonostachys byssicola TaxID=160290 RepID=A0A9N9XYY3_9HYPO|nr:unnamed protein product [Clonostachys byssicola]
MEWIGRATIEFTHAPSPRVVTGKDGQKTDLLKIVEEATPPCQLSPLLFNGHMQTIWAAMEAHGPPVYYRRKVFNADHQLYPGSFAVDFVVEPFNDADPDLPNRTGYFINEQLESLGSLDTKPMLVVLHGLSGGSHETYLRHTIAPLIREGVWEICVINSRGCAGSKITSGMLYNARSTWDVRQTVTWLRETFPNRPLFGLGFSLGANILTNYCGEEGPDCMLKAAVVCSNPFNLEITSKFLQARVIGREFYLRYMGTCMKSLMHVHRKELKMFTNLDTSTTEKIRYLNEFDREVQCPTWGYPTEYAYYRDASSVDAVLSIRVPFLAINATDDPIAVKEALPYEEFRQNPDTVLLTTSLGGHLCWYETGGGHWHTRVVANFLNELAFHTDLDNLKPGLTTPVVPARPRGAIYDPMKRKLAIHD